MLSLVLQVEDVYFPKERATGRRRPFCFVTFASQKVLFSVLRLSHPQYVHAQYVQRWASHCDAVLSLYIRRLISAKVTTHPSLFCIFSHFSAAAHFHLVCTVLMPLLLCYLTRASMPGLCY